VTDHVSSEPFASTAAQGIPNGTAPDVDQISPQGLSVEAEENGYQQGHNKDDSNVYNNIQQYPDDGYGPIGIKEDG
jgi:hypothetical protein